MLIRLLLAAILLHLVGGMALYPRGDSGDKEKGFKTRTEVRVGFQVNFDIGRLAQLIMNEKSISDNRASFVRGTLLKSAYAGAGNYSVLVFDLQQEFKWHLVPDYDHSVYTPAYYGLNIYAVWIFQGPAKFENFGSTGSINWAYYGKVKREGGNLTFYSM